MNNPLRTVQDYELFIYTLADQFPSILRSTMTLVRLGATLARVTGELHFAHDIRLVVRERILYHRLPAIMDYYSYEAWRDQERLSWYDPQPHPNEPSLQSTHPHHKHVPPDIKHNRYPAPGLSFVQPNLPLLIHEIEGEIATIEKD